MKYLITGGSGYIGGRLVDLILSRGDAEIVNVDIKPPQRERAGARFVRMDIRDRGMEALLHAERPDALVHLAFVLNPMRDEQTMYDIDVNGTQNVLDAASEGRRVAGAGRLQHDRLRRLAGQPRPTDRGRPRARHAELRVRARQDRDRPDLPAVGGEAP